MRKRIWTSFSLFLFLTLSVQAGCAPTPAGETSAASDQNAVQAAPTATTVPFLLSPDTFTPLPGPPNTPTPVIATTVPSTPTVDQRAVLLARQLVPQFTQVFGAKFNPDLARGLDSDKIGGPAGQLAEMIAPVVDQSQRYTDLSLEVREVEGILSINDNRLDFEEMTILNKATILSSPIPLGAYMIACHPARPNDCLAISLQRQEFQVNPETVFIFTITPSSPPPSAPTQTLAPTGTPTLTQTPAPPGTATLTGTPCGLGTPCPTAFPTLLATSSAPPPATATLSATLTQISLPTEVFLPPPTVDFETGSIRTCFLVFRRKVCIKVF
jgi:hypothetical protein